MQLLHRIVAILLRLTGFLGLVSLAAFVLWLTYVLLWLAGFAQPGHVGS